VFRCHERLAPYQREYCVDIFPYLGHIRLY